MLIIAIVLNLVCPSVLIKYDLLKYVNIFKTRSQMHVNIYNPACGMCYCGMRCLIPVATGMTKKILLGRRYDVPLFIYSKFVGMTI